MLIKYGAIPFEFVAHYEHLFQRAKVDVAARLNPQTQAVARFGHSGHGGDHKTLRHYAAKSTGNQRVTLGHVLHNAIYGLKPVARVLFEVSEWGISEQQVIMTGMLVLFPIVFFLAFWVACWAMVRITRRWAADTAPDGVTPVGMACSFVLTLVPIAVAYHLSHYFSFLFTTGQFIIPLASDPFGFGWNLFGTAAYRVNIGIISPYVFWYSAVTLIVTGHVIAVFLAHAVALRVFGGRRGALLSQIPMVTLMVAYTMLSLWILAQPIIG